MTKLHGESESEEATSKAKPPQVENISEDRLQHPGNYHENENEDRLQHPGNYAENPFEDRLQHPHGKAKGESQ